MTRLRRTNINGKTRCICVTLTEESINEIDKIAVQNLTNRSCEIDKIITESLNKQIKKKGIKTNDN